MDGWPIFVLSIGETVRLLCGVAEFLTADVSVVDVPDMLEESVVVVVVLAFGGVVVVAELSVCWLCVGVGAGAPVPSCVESVVGVAVVDGVVVVLVDEFIDDESVVVEDEGAVDPIEESVVVVDEGGVVVVVEDDGVVMDDESVVVVVDDGVVIDEESVVVDEDGVVVVDGDVVTSPVDVACEPSFETRM